jgi:hypothetical protein
MQVLNFLGLIANIIGVILLFIFGFPQPNFDVGSPFGLESNNILLNGKTVGENDIEILKLKRKYRLKSCIALGLIICGFLLQSLSVWYQNIISIMYK